MAVTASRDQVIAYRIAAQGLHRETADPLALAVLDLGVQDSGAHAYRLALDARLAATPPTDLVGPGRPLALAWSVRGAPHVLRRADLDAVAGALWPLSTADAATRLDASARMKKTGTDALDGWAMTVHALRSQIDAPTAKGAASAAVTAVLPDGMTRYCRVCRATHVFELPFRVGLLPAGLELEPDTSPPVLLPRPGAAAIDSPDVAAVQALIRCYLALLGPASIADAAGFLGARRAEIAGLWPDDLVEVEVDGRAGYLPPDRVGALRRPPRAGLVRLLGPFDPYLQARDRDLIVPDRSVHKVLWPVLGRPGVLLVDGEVAGVWRPRGTRKRLDLAIEAFVPLAPSVRAAIQDEAQRVAAVRGAEQARVQLAD